MPLEASAAKECTLVKIQILPKKFQIHLKKNIILIKKLSIFLVLAHLLSSLMSELKQVQQSKALTIHFQLDPKTTNHPNLIHNMPNMSLALFLQLKKSNLLKTIFWQHKANHICFSNKPAIAILNTIEYPT